MDAIAKNQFKSRLYQYNLSLLKFLSKQPLDVITNEIKKQLIRCGTSTGANYFEALAASSKRDFINFFHHSLKSINESKFWLGIIRDIRPTDVLVLNYLIKETEEIGNILAASILTMKGKRKGIHKQI
ncbi:four helix bundle protein [Candidatus Falkowbacteria bacterium]|nr:four helix bundle protein [Candidatus Falkowbacteria bacterium]